MFLSIYGKFAHRLPGFHKSEENTQRTGIPGKLSIDIQHDTNPVIHMSQPIILASTSDVRQTLLRRAGVPFDVIAPRIDETALRDALLADSATPRDIADALAEYKARKISDKRPEALVIGCDQVLEFQSRVLGKPESEDALLRQLQSMRNTRHSLHSAVVLYDGGKPVWRHVGSVNMTVRPLSDGYLKDYVARNWLGIKNVAGGYKLEEEGVRLFSRIEGDYFHVLGLPLIELLSYLGTRGMIEQ